MTETKLKLKTVGVRGKEGGRKATFQNSVPAQAKKRTKRLGVKSTHKLQERMPRGGGAHHRLKKKARLSELYGGKKKEGEEKLTAGEKKGGDALARTGARKQEGRLNKRKGVRVGGRAKETTGGDGKPELFKTKKSSRTKQMGENKKRGTKLSSH